MEALLETKYLDTRSSSELDRVSCDFPFFDEFMYQCELDIGLTDAERNISRAIFSLTAHTRIAKRSSTYNGMAMLPGVTRMMPDFTQGFIKRGHLYPSHISCNASPDPKRCYPDPEKRVKTTNDKV